MTAVTRLVTFADADGDGTDFAVSARHEAELADGRRVLLLDDRGWAQSPGWPPPSADDVRETTRTVVGPDEPFDGVTAEDMAAGHWESLRRVLRRQGIDVDAAVLRALPHDVVLSRRLLARIGEPDSDA